jgi:hypothetical protein
MDNHVVQEITLITIASDSSFCLFLNGFLSFHSNFSIALVHHFGNLIFGLSVADEVRVQTRHVNKSRGKKVLIFLKELN